MCYVSLGRISCWFASISPVVKCNISKVIKSFDYLWHIAFSIWKYRSKPAGGTTVIYFYTAFNKNEDTKLTAVTPANHNVFFIILSPTNSSVTFAVKWLLNFPPRLKRVAWSKCQTRTGTAVQDSAAQNCSRKNTRLVTRALFNLPTKRYYQCLYSTTRRINDCRQWPATTKEQEASIRWQDSAPPISGGT